MDHTIYYCTGILILLQSVTAAPGQQLTPECEQFSEQIRQEIDSGHLREAEDGLKAALRSNPPTLDPFCSALVTGKLAALMSISARDREAEIYAEDALNRFDKIGGVGHEFLLRPLHELAATRVQQGKISAARLAFEKLRRIATDNPEELALVHSVSAALLQAEGKLADAETEYTRALDDWQKGGRADSVDSASVLAALGSLYFKQKRFGEAVRMSNTALSVVASAKDTNLMDRIMPLCVRAAAYAKLSEWHTAREDMQSAVSLAEQQPRIDPELLSDLLAAYAATLRKDHSSREARGVRARASALHAQHTKETVVDLSELLRQHE